MTFFKWSKTAANNANADSTCPFPEGMAASALNDGTRGMMAAAAKYRDDISGATVTAGTATAYTLGTNEGFDTLLNLNTQMVAFTPHATNGATVTLNVDALGAKPLRSAPGVELLAGRLILGTPYVAVYNNTDGVFYLQGFFGNPYSIPLGGGIDYWLPTAPNSSFAFPFGQAISRTTYAALFAAMGTAYGVGDGGTTFNLPDKRGRVSAGGDVMGGAGANRLTNASGMNGIGIGSVGGGETQTLTAAQIPSITSANAGAIALSVTTSQKVINGPNQGSAAAGGSQVTAADAGSGGALSAVGSTGNIAIGAAAVTSNNTGGQAHPIVQPTIVCNYIIRII
jgi:microcystin-dependent protein